MSTPVFHSLSADLENLAAKSQELVTELKNTKKKVQSNLRTGTMDQHSKEVLQYKLHEIMDVLQLASLKW